MREAGTISQTFYVHTGTTLIEKNVIESKAMSHFTVISRTKCLKRLSLLRNIITDINLRRQRPAIQENGGRDVKQ